MKFLTTEQLGDTQSLTPEGFLLCEGVPVARTGVMIYGPDEIPVSSGPDGVVRVTRDEEDVFDPKYMASLNGKSVVIHHPEQDVDPSNWKDFTVGVVLNPRRGKDSQADLLLCDLLITDAEGIQLIREGTLREVSCGYQADYDEIEPGLGRQYNFIGNHIALVEKGRCGSRCSIADHETIGDIDMARTNDETLPRRVRIADRILKALKARDEEGIAAAAEELKTGDEEPDGDQHMHIHLPGNHVTKDEFGEHQDQNAREHAEMMARISALEAKLGKTGDEDPDTKSDPGTTTGDEDDPDVKKAEEEKTGDEDDPDVKKAEDSEAEAALEQELAEEAPAGTKDRARKARDSAYLEDSYQETVSLAEILVPGIRLPTYDRAATAKKTFDSICNLRRRALDAFALTGEGNVMVSSISGGSVPDLKNMTCSAVRTLFRAAAAMKKQANSAVRTGDITSAGKPVTSGKIRSLADWNKANRELYGRSN